MSKRYTKLFLLLLLSSRRNLEDDVNNLNVVLVHIIVLCMIFGVAQGCAMLFYISARPLCKGKAYNHGYYPYAFLWQKKRGLEDVCCNFLLLEGDGFNFLVVFMRRFFSYVQNYRI